MKLKSKKLVKLDSPIKVYDLTVDHECHNFSLANGVKVHNCVSASPGSGKSLWLMHQASIAAHAGKKVFYLAAGDLKPSDFLVRIGAMVTNTPIREVFMNVAPIASTAKEYLAGNLSISCVPSQKVTAREYVNYCLSRINDFDVFILDYDANLSTESDNMYEAGGELYDMLTEISSMGKLVFVASQPKINTWNHDVLDLNSLNESSRKQHILDMVITISKSHKAANHVGIINIAKNRRGELARRPYLMTSSGRMVEIPMDKYQLLNANPSKLTPEELDYDNIVSGEVNLKFTSEMDKNKVENHGE